MERSRDQPAPPVGKASLGDLRRVAPISASWGTDRGRPVDRAYIESFLARHSGDVRGQVLEVKDPGYTRMFGGDRVTRSDVLDIDPANAKATILADLQRAPHLQEDGWDCVLLTQVLPVIFDVGAALDTVHRILRPGGVLLLTAPGPFSPPFEGDTFERFWWAFYPSTVRRLLEERFAKDRVQVEARGNLATCAAFIAGLAQEDLAPEDWATDDPRYPLIISARAVKGGLAHDRS